MTSSFAMIKIDGFVTMLLDYDRDRSYNAIPRTRLLTQSVRQQTDGCGNILGMRRVQWAEFVCARSGPSGRTIMPSTTMSSSPLHGDAADILSREATLALRDAFRRHLTEPSHTVSGDVTAALALVCREARREQIPAERLLVAFKSIWSSLPEVRQMPPNRAADEVRDLVSLCIERYYAPE